MTETYLYHHGILGQKWGVRRFQNPDGTLTEAGRKHKALEGIPRSTKRDARKDAKEYATAKMYYGEGAGTRRKRINAIVNQRSKDEAYKKAYDYYLGQQDMAKRGAAARAERKTRDAASTTARTARGLVNIATGNIGRASSLAISLASAYAIAKATGADQVVKQYADMAIKTLIDKSRIPKFH